MEEHGRIIAAMQPRQGISQRDGQPWISQEFVMEIDGRYTRRVKFSIFGQQLLSMANLQVGDFVTVKAEVEAHEYQGNWFNEVRCYDVLKQGQSVRTAMQAPVQNGFTPNQQMQQNPYPGNVPSPQYVNGAQQYAPQQAPGCQYSEQNPFPPVQYPEMR